MTTDQLTTAEVARIAGLSVASVRRYRTRRAIPEPDGYLGTTPWWHRRTIEHWLETRPGRGKPSTAGT